MTYDISLKTVGLLLGILLVGTHLVALFKEEKVRRWLTAFPRSYTIGVVLLTADFVWTFSLMMKMDWGEFFNLQKPLLIALPIFFYLTIRYVDEFLSVRALGILGLLVASPILDAAFLKPQESRLLVVVLAYAYLILGMFWIGIPHLLRDQISWLLRSATRWKAAIYSGIIYGAVVLLSALLWY